MLDIRSWRKLRRFWWVSQLQVWSPVVLFLAINVLLIVLSRHITPPHTDGKSKKYTVWSPISHLAAHEFSTLAALATVLATECLKLFVSLVLCFAFDASFSFAELRRVLWRGFVHDGSSR